jgi:nitroreductase
MNLERLIVKRPMKKIPKFYMDNNSFRYLEVRKMDIFETINKRRSSRKFTDKLVPKEVMQKSFEAAVKAPNSSNLQTWRFWWIKDPSKKKKLVEYCFNQSAAREAKELVVITADPNLWKISNPEIIKYAERINAPKLVKFYYEKLVPITYRVGWFGVFTPFKKLSFFITGLFRPITRRPGSMRDLQEIAIKSAALGAENFVLSLEAQGFSSCMMEGHDELRVLKLLGLRAPARTAMVIGVGEPSDRALWGEQFRLPLEEVVKEV